MDDASKWTRYWACCNQHLRRISPEDGYSSIALGRLNGGEAESKIAAGSTISEFEAVSVLKHRQLTGKITTTVQHAAVNVFVPGSMHGTPSFQ